MWGGRRVWAPPEGLRISRAESALGIYMSSIALRGSEPWLWCGAGGGRWGGGVWFVSGVFPGEGAETGRRGVGPERDPCDREIPPGVWGVGEGGGGWRGRGVSGDPGSGEWPVAILRFSWGGGLCCPIECPMFGLGPKVTGGPKASSPNSRGRSCARAMESCRAATITSVNKYLLEARGDLILKESVLPVIVFRQASMVLSRAAGRTVGRALRGGYPPGGGTSFSRRLGRGVDSLDKKAADNKAILVIVTDGEENSSKKHNYESIKALIEDRQRKGWLIIFLGAGLSSAQQGLRMSIRAANVANIGLDEASLGASISVMTAINGAYASTKTAAEARAYAASLKFTPELRAMMGDKSDGAAHLCRGATLPRRT